MALSGLNSRLDNLVEQLISSYNISEQDLEVRTFLKSRKHFTVEPIPKNIQRYDLVLPVIQTHSFTNIFECLFPFISFLLISPLF